MKSGSAGAEDQLAKNLSEHSTTGGRVVKRVAVGVVGPFEHYVFSPVPGSGALAGKDAMLSCYGR